MIYNRFILCAFFMHTKKLKGKLTMTKKHFSIKSVMLALLLSVSFLFLPCFMPVNSSNFANSETAFAASNSVTEIDSTSTVGLNNASFINGGGTTPQSPTNWTKADGSSVDPEYKGIINLSSGSMASTTTRERYGFTQYGDDYLTTSFLNNPDADDTKVLLINSPTTQTSFGYTNSDEFTLEANSFYEIKVNVFTYGDAFASIYLVGDDFENAKITSIKSTKHWSLVSLFVKTNQISNSKAKLELFMGEKNKSSCTGFVCFDNISVIQYSPSTYNETKSASSTNLEIDLSNTLTPITSGNGFITNGDFSNSLTNWESSGAVFANFDNPILVNEQNITIGSNQYGNTTGAVLRAKNSVASLKSSEFTVGKMKIYRINFWAKHSVNEGNAKFEIVGKQSNEAYLEPEEKSASITNLSSGRTITNGWANYDLYITGDSRFDTTAYLKFSLGENDKLATGYVAIAGITSYEISESEKSKATSTNTYNASLEMENSASLTFANSTFNQVTIESDVLPAPKNWTSLNDQNTESGVVNVLDSSVCPNKQTGTSDNVLQIRNSLNTSYQAYQSESTNISSDGYAKLTFETSTKNVSGKVWAILSDDNNNPIYSFDIDSPNKWTTYTLALKNYSNDINVRLTLYLGNSSTPSTGYAFFDNCSLSTSLTEDEFNSLATSSTVAKVDLSTEQLTANDNGKPRYLTVSTDSTTTQTGIVKAKDFSIGVEKNTLSGPNDGNDEIVYIYSGTPTHTTLTTNFAYSFDADTYYKVSAKIKTVGIPKTTDYRYDENGNKVQYGATFQVEGIESYFTGINTKTSKSDLTISQQFKETSNEWVEYTIYLNPTEAKTSKIVFGLGNSEILASGYAFFSDLNIKTLTEDEYKSLTATYESEVPFNVLLASSTDDEDEDKEENKSFDSAAWFAIPTAIIALAVIVAIVGYFIRKVKSERRPQKEKVAEADYNRLSTLLKDVDKKERKTEIKHKITLLREELKQSEKYLAEETEELQKVRAGEVDTSDGKPVNPKQLEKSIETQNEKIAEIKLDIKVLEDEYQKILDKQK